MKIKVLYISYDGMTDPLGQSQVLPYLIELSKEYDIHILSTEKKVNYNLRKQTISDISDKNNIHWHPINYTRSPPVLSTIKDIQNLRKTAFSLNEKHQFSIVHCRSYISALVGLEMKKKCQTKFVFDMRGFWADERVDGNIWNIKNPVFKFIYNYFKKKEIEFFQEADYTISLTQAGKNEINSWKEFQGVNLPIQVIPCCADLNHFSIENVNLETQNNFRTRLGISSNDFIISYLGSIGTWYMLSEMLDFFVVLKQHKKNAKFLFITTDDKNDIIDAATSKGINIMDILITPSERNDLPSLITLSDISIFFIMPAYSKKASSPTKQAELLSLGIPIICNGNVGDTGKIIEENNCGEVINEFNDETYLNVVKNMEEISMINKDHLRKVALSYASLEIGANSYLEVYHQILK